MKEILSFVLLFFSFNLVKAQSCTTCNGTGSVYVERKVNTGKQSQWTESETHIYQTIKNTHSIEGSYESCRRCNGSGFIKRTVSIRKKPEPIPATFRGKLIQYIKSQHHWATEPSLYPTGISSIYKVVFNIGGKKTIYVRRSGQNLDVIADYESFRKADFLKGPDGDVGLAILTEEWEDQDGWNVRVPYTKLFDKNGNLVFELNGYARGTGGSYVWIKPQKSSGYKLFQFPSMTQVSSKFLMLDEDSTLGNLLNNHGIIDVNYKGKRYLFDDELKHFGPSKHSFIGIDKSSLYVYFVDEKNIVKTYTIDGKMVVPKKTKDRDCGTYFNCTDLISKTIPENSTPSLSNIVSQNLTLLISTNKKEKLLLENLSEYDQGGWAQGTIANNTEEVLIHKNGTVALAKGKDADFYREKKLPQPIVQEEQLSTYNSDPTNEVVITNDGELQGAQISWQNKELNLPFIYTEVKAYFNKVVIFKNKQNKYGFYLKNSATREPYLSVSIYDDIIPTRSNEIYIKKKNRWYLMIGFKNNAQPSEYPISEILSKGIASEKSFKLATERIAAHEAGFDHKPLYTYLRAFDFREVTRVYASSHNPYVEILERKGKEDLIFVEYDGVFRLFPRTRMDGMSEIGYFLYSSNHTLLLPFYNNSTKKYHVLHLFKNKNKVKMREGKSFIFDRLYYSENPDGTLNGYGGNDVGVFGFEDITIQAPVPDKTNKIKKTTVTMPIPTELF